MRTIDLKEETLEKRLNMLDESLHRDPGGRGLASAGVKDPVGQLYDALKDVKRAVLLTGFPVRLPDGRITGETDGPLGTADMARALEKSGAQVIVLSDRFCIRQVEAALRARGCAAPLKEVPDQDSAVWIDRLFDEVSPTHLITLERPGKARDGHYYNMRGGIIDAMITDTSMILAAAKRCGTLSIAVGDGGNELGMGALRPIIEEKVPHGSLICADAAADIALVSGVSNWWGSGIAALLSLIHQKDLLPSPEEVRRVLRAVIASGGADGCTAKAEETVDALPAETHLEILAAVKAAIKN